MSEEKIVEEVPGADKKTESSGETRPDRKANPLRQALNRARQQEVERSDVIVDLREAELARLELLQDALSDVFEALPEDHDLLECALVPSTPPRLWVDVLGHIVMGRDKRTYRFVKDTRYGRQVILETTSLEEMASRVTDYVAHRLLERQRALESDAGGRSPAVPPDAVPIATVEGPSSEPMSGAGMSAEQPVEPAPRSGSAWWMLFGFLVGAVAGAGGLLVAGLLLTAP